MISNIANIQVSFRPKLNAVGAIESRFGSRTSISRKPCFAHTGHGADAVGFGVYSANDMVFHFHNEKIARLIKSYFVGFVKFRFRCGTSFATVSFPACASECGDDPGFPVHFPYSMVHGVANVQGSCRPFGDAKRAVYFCLCCWSAIAGIAFISRANKSDDRSRMNNASK